MKLQTMEFESKIQTERLKLRKLHKKDREMLFEIYSHEDSARLDDWVPMLNREEADKLIIQSIENYENKSEVRNGVEDVTRNLLVGSCGLFAFDEWNKKCMIYYQIHHNERNKGYASEAIKGLVQYAFSTLGCNRIEAYVTPGNDSSIRALEKNAFRCEGLMREMEFYKGQYWDGIIMAILKKDWVSEE